MVKVWKEEGENNGLLQKSFHDEGQAERGQTQGEKGGQQEEEKVISFFRLDEGTGVSPFFLFTNLIWSAAACRRFFFRTRNSRRPNAFTHRVWQLLPS